MELNPIFFIYYDFKIQLKTKFFHNEHKNLAKMGC